MTKPYVFCGDYHGGTKAFGIFSDIHWGTKGEVLYEMGDGDYLSVEQLKGFDPVYYTTSELCALISAAQEEGKG